jgi:hypothetical protein
LELRRHGLGFFVVAASGAMKSGLGAALSHTASPVTGSTGGFHTTGPGAGGWGKVPGVKRTGLAGGSEGG